MAQKVTSQIKHEIKQKITFKTERNAKNIKRGKGAKIRQVTVPPRKIVDDFDFL